jgi:hypothetical protein
MSQRLDKARHATSAGQRNSAIRRSISTGRPVKVRNCCKLVMALVSSRETVEEVEGPPREGEEARDSEPARDRKSFFVSKFMALAEDRKARASELSLCAYVLLTPSPSLNAVGHSWQKIMIRYQS